MARGAGIKDQQLDGSVLRGRGTRSQPRLDPGFKASETELMEYTYGQCHSLALAMHQQTGWRLAGCNWSDDPEPVPGHIFVIDDEGNGVDIHGRHRRGRHPDPGIDADWKPIGAEQIQAWVDTDDYDAIDAGRSEYTAELMLGISDTIILPA